MQRRELYFAVILFCFLCASFARAQNPTIEGYVVNRVTGQPIADARVKLDPRTAEPLYTKTDPQGHFQFSAPEARAYILSAERPGFSQRGASIAGRRLAPVRIELSPYSVIAGKVTDPNGLPVRNCAIEILLKRPVGARPAGFPVGQVLPGGEYEIARQNGTNTNDLGEFRAARLEPGTYYVVANKARDFTWLEDYRITYYPHALDLASAKPVQVAPGSEVRADIQIVRQGGVRVSGRLIEPAGQETASGPRHYTNLALVPQQNVLLNANGPFAMARTDEFEFTDVLPGKYTLLALTRDIAAGDPWGGNQKPVFGTASEIEIKDRDMDGLNVALQPLRDLPGVVTFTEGCTPTQVRINARGSSALASGAAEAVSGADGSFVLRGLTPAKVNLSVAIVSTPYRPAPIVSVRLGERDVLNNAFDYPVAGNDTLKIVMGCAANRRPQ